MIVSSNEYVNSEIANYLDSDYFDNLPESIRNAIVETPIQQTKLNNYTDINPTDWGEKTDAGKHKVFIPSWDEVTNVYGSTKEGLKAYAPNGWTWLRDTFDSGVLGVLNDGGLSIHQPNGSHYVRPAFVIDLSNVDYNLK